jgi:hypothetical protein
MCSGDVAHFETDFKCNFRTFYGGMDSSCILCANEIDFKCNFRALDMGAFCVLNVNETNFKYNYRALY